MNAGRETVYIVDDDVDVCNVIRKLVESVGLHAEVYYSARNFLDHAKPGGPSCIVLDVRMPESSGLDLQKRLATNGRRIPVIFLTGHGSVAMSVEAMKAGAVDFLEKPIESQKLIDAIQGALETSRREWGERDRVAATRARYDSLSKREKEVFELVVSGLPNKHIAAELHISEKTVKAHRSSVMHKMEADSLASLVHMAHELGIMPSPQPPDS